MVVDAQYPLESIHPLAGDPLVDGVTNSVPSPGAVVVAAAALPPPGLRARLRRWVFASSHTEYVDLMGSSHQHRSCCG